MAEPGRVINIRTEDQCDLGVTVFGTAVANDGAVVVCTPAMGVTASYYEPVALAVARTGCIAITADLRGLGLSSVRAGRRSNFGYKEILVFDLPAVLNFARDTFPGHRVVLFGHSLGGQLSCLFASANSVSVSGIILVATCSVYYRGWPFPMSAGILAFEQFAHLVAGLIGHFPGRFFRFGNREARGVLRDWSHQGRTGRYEVAGSDLDFESLLGKMDKPVLAFSFSDDGYAPEKAVRHLLDKMKSAPIDHVHLKPQHVGVESIGHFGWVKRPELIVPYMQDWMERLAG